MTTRRLRWSARLGAIALAGVVLLALAAPVIAPNDPDRQFADRAYAPPTRIRVFSRDGVRAPFIHPQVLENRLFRTYRDDPDAVAPLRWFAQGRLLSVEADAGPLFLLGADALGRDVFSRLLYGARLSIGVAAVGLMGALLIGAAVGGLAGSVGGALESALMMCADFVIVLPGTYLVLVLRGVLPLVLSVGAVFWLMAILFAVSAWPHAARGVRSIVAVERSRAYAEAARAAGAGRLRVARHLLPAAKGFLAVETALLLPALLVAESTISYLGLGFPAPEASWGTMLQDAGNVRMLAEAPWILAPAGLLFLVVLAVQLIFAERVPSGVLQGGQIGSIRH